MRNFLLAFLVLPMAICLGSPGSFEQLMGKKTAAWNYIKTPEDRKRLSFFSKAFESSLVHFTQPRKGTDPIPNTFHFIWLGPQPFPKASGENLKRWKELHPAADVILWSDRSRFPPSEGIEVRLISVSDMELLGDEFYLSTTFREKARILAYELLFLEGGVYVDVDVNPLKSLASFRHLDFFCGLEPLGPSTLSSSVVPGTHLLGARAGHPILEETITWLKEHWSLLETSYSGVEGSACTHRADQRTYGALTEGLDRAMGKDGMCDMVFPSAYFSEREASPLAYATYRGESCVHKAVPIENQSQDRSREALITLIFAGVSLLLLLVYVGRTHRRSS